MSILEGAQTIISGRNQQIEINKIKVGTRLRKIDQSKVNDLVESIQLIGLLQPIVIDTDNNLLAGNHRLEAHKILGESTIECKRISLSELENELVQIDENLILNQLSILETSEHLIRREEILTKLGKRSMIGENQHTKTGSDGSDTTSTTEDLATELGISERQYQRIKQVYKIHPEARELLIDTPHSDNLEGLLSIERNKESIQIEVAKILHSQQTSSVSRAIVLASLDDYYLDENYEFSENFNFVEHFGEIPKSVMKFQNSKHEQLENLEKIISKVDEDEELKPKQSTIMFGTTPLRISRYHTSQSLFLIDYYTKPDYRILDPCCGRGTRSITSLFLGRKYVGFDVCPKTIDLNRKVIDNHFKESKDKVVLYNSDGCELEPFLDQKDVFDTVFTSPPYVGTEKHSGEDGDLSFMKIDLFEESIKKMFLNLYRLIKPSDFKNKVLHPVIFTIGSRRFGEDGLYDMDYHFQRISGECGFKLWDKVINENISPAVAVGFNNKYDRGYVAKTHETTLIWIK